MTTNRNAIAAGALVLALVASVTTAALRTDGYRETRVDLHEGGVWVTRPGQLGRLNTQIDSIELSIKGTTGGDVAQAGSTVVMFDQAKGTMQSVDAALASASEPQPIPADAVVAMGGQAGLVADPVKGRVWLAAGEQLATINTKSVKPSFLAAGDERHVAATIGVDGTAFIYQRDSKVLRSLALGPDGKAQTLEVPLSESVSKAQVTVVGASPVLLDGERSRLVVPGRSPVDLSRFGADLVLQQPGPDSSAVLVGSKKELISVDLASGSARSIATGGTGGPIAPVFADGCAFGAWAATSGRPSWARSCADHGAISSKAKAQPIDVGVVAGARLRFRVNRDRVVLNDTDSGINLTVDDEEPKVVNDWKQALDKSDQPSDQQKKVKQQQDTKCSDTPSAPSTEPDTAGTRPDQPVVVRVLDNDRSDSCDVLSIEPYGRDEGPAGAAVAVVDNGGALQVTPDADRTDPILVPYVAVGKGGKSIGSLTVNVTAPDDNGDPVAKADKTVVEVNKAVRHNVLLNDTDPDGDPLSLINVSAPKDGRMQYQADGTISYRAPGVNPGQVTLTYTVADDSGAESTGELNIQVIEAGVNLAPTARNDRLVAVVGREASINLLANDTDPNDDPLKVSTVQEKPGVGLDWDTDGTLRVKPTRAGAYFLTYEIHDGETTAKGTVLVQVHDAGENQPPVAVRDDTVARPGTPALVDLVANDLDADGDLLAVTGIIVPPGSGLAVELIGMRLARVTADASFTKTASVTYTVSDGSASSSGRLIVRPHRVSGQDQEPITVADAGSVRPGNVTTIPVLRNDVDPEGEQLSLVAVKALDPAAGRVFIQGDELRFQAAIGARRSVTTTYTVADPAGNRADGEVRLDIIDPAQENRPPDGPRLEARVFAGQSINIPVPLLGADPDGDVVSIVGVAPNDPPRRGSVKVVGDGFVYEAPQDASGSDSFSFTLRDPGRKEGTGIVRVVIAPVPSTNSAPQAIPDKAWVLAGQSRVLPVLANDVDADNDEIVLDPAGGISGPSPGRGTVKVDGDRLVYTAPAKISEDDPGVSFTYGINDRRGGSARGLVNISLLTKPRENEAPLAKDDFVQTTLANRKVTVDVLANDRDPDDRDPGDNDKGLTVRVLDFHGATVRPDGKLSVQLAKTSVSFLYEVTDVGGEGGPKTAMAVVSIPVVEAFPPVANDDAITLKAGTSKVLKVLTNDKNPSGKKADLDVIKVFNQRGVQTRLVDDKAGTVEVTAALTAPRASAFSYQISNGPEQAVASVAVTVLPPPKPPGQKHQDDPKKPDDPKKKPDEPQKKPPTLVGTSVELLPGGERSLDLQLLTVDPDTKSHTFRLTQQPTGGVKAKLRGHTLNVSASEDAGGANTQIGIEVSDGTSTATGRIPVHVTEETVEPPVAVDDAGETRQGEPVDLAVTKNDVDPAGKGLQLTGASVSGGASVGTAKTSGGTLTYTPGGSFAGTALITYTVRDKYKKPREVTGTVKVTVYGRPGAPPAPSGTAESKTIKLSWGSADPNGSPITGYVVEAEGGDHRHQVTSNSAVIDGLTNGTSYRFRVAALNEHFKDPNDSGIKWSQYSPALTPDQRPDSPGAPTASFVKDRNGGGAGGVLQVSWSAPNVDGSPIQQYLVSVSPPAGGGTRTVGADTTSLEWTGLNNGTAYSFSMVAENKAGKSDPSPQSATAIPAGVPKQVTGVTAERVSDSRNDNGGLATVKWNATDANGDPDGLRYEVTTNPPTSSKPVEGTEVEMDVRSPDQKYSFIVTPENKAGKGDPGRSTEIYAEGKPAAPANPQFLPESNSIKLFGISSQNARGPGTVTFQYSIDGGASWPTLSRDRISRANNSTPVRVLIRGCKNGSSGSGPPVGCGDSSPGHNQITNDDEVTPFAPPVLSSTKPSDRTITWTWTHVVRQGGGLYTFIGEAGSENCGSECYRETFGYEQQHCLKVQVRDQGVTQTSNERCETTIKKPPPPRTVSISKGADGYYGGCTRSKCWEVNISTSFGGPYTLECFQNGSRFYGPQGFSGSPSGQCWSGFSGDLYVRVNGVESNHVAW